MGDSYLEPRMNRFITYSITDSKLLIQNSDGSIFHEQTCTLDEARNYLREALNVSNPLMEDGGYSGPLSGVVRPPRID